MRPRVGLGFLVVVAAMVNPIGMRAASAAAPSPTSTPVLSFHAGETGTKTATLPVPQAQCRAMMAAKHLTGADTSCIETMTAGSSSQPVAPVKTGTVAAAASGWWYVYHYTEQCWGPSWSPCYFLTIKTEATFQIWYGSSVWVAAGTGVSCTHPTMVWPYSASIYWCGGWNNGGAPVYGNNWGHWMNIGDNATVRFGSGVQACGDHWQRLAVDVWGNWWANGG